MGVHTGAYESIVKELKPKNVTLVAVSKTKPAEDIQEMYHLGQRDFGENYVQELTNKQVHLPSDIRWHFIGHLQSNKVKYIVPFVHLIHGVDSRKLLVEINKQASKIQRNVACLLQVHIAQEETKFGFDESELMIFIQELTKNAADFGNVTIKGLMGMASFSNDKEKVREEFKVLKRMFDKCSAVLGNSKHMMEILSMGMSADYDIAIAEGSSMVRIGSLLFGNRSYPQ